MYNMSPTRYRTNKSNGTSGKLSRRKNGGEPYNLAAKENEEDEIIYLGIFEPNSYRIHSNSNERKNSATDGEHINECQSSTQERTDNYENHNIQYSIDINTANNGTFTDSCSTGSKKSSSHLIFKDGDYCSTADDVNCISGKCDLGSDSIVYEMPKTREVSNKNEIRYTSRDTQLSISADFDWPFDNNQDLSQSAPPTLPSSPVDSSVTSPSPRSSPPSPTSFSGSPSSCSSSSSSALSSFLSSPSYEDSATVNDYLPETQTTSSLESVSIPIDTTKNRMYNIQSVHGISIDKGKMENLQRVSSDIDKSMGDIESYVSNDYLLIKQKTEDCHRTIVKPYLNGISSAPSASDKRNNINSYEKIGSGTNFYSNNVLGVHYELHALLYELCKSYDVNMRKSSGNLQQGEIFLCASVLFQTLARFICTPYGNHNGSSTNTSTGSLHSGNTEIHMTIKDDLIKVFRCQCLPFYKYGWYFKYKTNERKCVKNDTSDSSSLRCKYFNFYNNYILNNCDTYGLYDAFNAEDSPFSQTSSSNAGATDHGHYSNTSHTTCNESRFTINSIPSIPACKRTTREFLPPSPSLSHRRAPVPHRYPHPAPPRAYNFHDIYNGYEYYILCICMLACLQYVFSIEGFCSAIIKRWIQSLSVYNAFAREDISIRNSNISDTYSSNIRINNNSSSCGLGSGGNRSHRRSKDISTCGSGSLDDGSARAIGSKGGTASSIVAINKFMTPYAIASDMHLQREVQHIISIHKYVKRCYTQDTCIGDCGGLLLKEDDVISRIDNCRYVDDNKDRHNIGGKNGNRKRRVPCYDVDTHLCRVLQDVDLVMRILENHVHVLYIYVNSRLIRNLFISLDIWEAYSLYIYEVIDVLCLSPTFHNVSPDQRAHGLLHFLTVHNKTYTENKYRDVYGCDIPYRLIGKIFIQDFYNHLTLLPWTGGRRYAINKLGCCPDTLITKLYAVDKVTSQ